jgi:5-formyltetrahydrofolate cyclo-ligase
MCSKEDIRKSIRQKKKLLSSEDKLQASELVFKQLFQLEQWKQANRVLSYHSLPDELQTIEYLDKMLSKELFLPKVDGDTLKIVAYDKSRLITGAYNILEPDDNNYFPVEDIELIIIPGVAFDKQKNRLGRGKGYYDKLLSNTEAFKIGICYDFQLVDEISTDAHDIKMDIVIAPNCVII